MSVIPVKPFATVSGPMEALEQLWFDLHDSGDPTRGATAVSEDELPHPFRWLLAHDAHMTKVLEARYDAPAEVQVWDERHDGDLYTRKIVLTIQGSDVPVEYGIPRLDLRFMPPQVRDEILAKQKPLGSILIAHNVHRTVCPRWYLRFEPNSPLLREFHHPGDAPLYGRIGTILCNGEPAIDLLEIVTAADQKEVSPWSSRTTQS